MKNIACIGHKIFCIKENGLVLNAGFSFFKASDVFLEYLSGGQPLPDVILFDLTHDTAHEFRQLRYNMLKKEELARIPFIVVSQYPSLQLLYLSKKFRVKDYFIHPAMLAGLQSRLQQILQSPPLTASPFIPSKEKNSAERKIKDKIPLWKRLFDILSASFLLLLGSPVLILVAILIKLESKGPVFYVSKRAGQGYKVFDFYKFRSMRMDADHKLIDLRDQNQYFSAAAVVENMQEENVLDEASLLMMDQGFVNEQKIMAERKINNSQTFFKIKNDPRITRIGRFIRATSIDEMPQLLNVLKGDMSLVGNRPLPLYEAERLTSDEWVLRFSAPAGITGLWQVSKCKEGEEMEEDRKQLDITYAKHYNFWLDCKILLLTLPAAFQRADS